MQETILNFKEKLGVMASSRSEPGPSVHVPPDPAVKLLVIACSHETQKSELDEPGVPGTAGMPILKVWGGCHTCLRRRTCLGRCGT